MKRLLHHITFALCCFLPFTLSAQHIYDGYMGTNQDINFSSGTPPGYIPDSATVPLWQIGLTHKTSFAPTSAGVKGIMTDTFNHYPVNANNSFVIKIGNSLNVIVDFWHRYQTDSSHDGGVVEFSVDHGAHWENLKGDCSADSGGTAHFPGTLTQNFYGFNDTLPTGEQAFSGNSHGTQYCRLQFFTAIPIRTTSGGCSFSTDSIYLRFRFISDTTADTLDGWMIESLTVEHDIYWGGVIETAGNTQLPIAPNPSPTGIFTLPELKNEDELTITVFNLIGQKLAETPYKRSIDISNYPAGMYLYKVSGNDQFYGGRLIYR